MIEIVCEHFHDACALSICFNIQAFTVKEQYSTRNYLQFKIRSNITFDVFLLPEGEEITMQTQVFTSAPTVFGIQGESMVSLSATKMKRNNHCNPDRSTRENADCLVGLLKEDLRKRPLKCMPFLFNKTFYEFGLKQCEDDAESKDSTFMVICKMQNSCGMLYCIELLGFGHLYQRYSDSFGKRLSAALRRNQL